jgi:hypothetical protein
MTLHIVRLLIVALDIIEGSTLNFQFHLDLVFLVNYPIIFEGVFAVVS